MNREKRLTKRERKAAAPPRPGARPAQGQQHIHCIACGRHLDPSQFDAPMSAVMLGCQHGKTFPSCTTCAAESRELIATHDRTGQNVQTAAAWH